MKKRVIILILAIFLVHGLALGYDNMVIHPKLSGAAVEIYNRQAERKITSEESAWIVAGAIAEDTDPRYLNHFYDPATDKGLKYLGVDWPSAKDWVQEQNSATGDYSAGAILDNYRQDNIKRAWQGIGHILHLFQDMAVPAHTRLDPHPDGDPYEGWAWGNGNIQADQIQIISVNDLAVGMKNLADYTKNNFYSQDTINVNINADDSKIKDGFYYCTDNLGNTYRCLRAKKSPDGLVLEINNDQIHQDYWRLLAPKAAGYSAGVIEWFVREFDKIDREKAEEEKNLLGAIKKSFAWIGDIFRAPASLAYVWGDVYRPAREEVFEKGKEAVETGKTAVGAVKSSIETGKENVVAAVDAGLDAAEDIKEGMAEGVRVLGEAFEPPLAAAGNEEDQAGRVFAAFEAAAGAPANAAETKTARVIDGDTIELDNGEKIRYIGIDAPELRVPGPADDECLAWVAKVRNEQLLGAGALKVVTDPGGERDKYGRLLGYVYAGDLFINERLAKEGLAREYFCRPGWENCPLAQDKERRGKIETAAADAIDNKRGLFSGVCDPAPEKIGPGEAPGEEKREEEIPLPSRKPVILFGSGPATPVNSGESEEEDTAGSDSGEAAGGETAPPPDEEISGSIAEFYLFDLLTRGRSYTASTAAGVYAETTSGSIPGEYLLAVSGAIPDIYGEGWTSAVPSVYGLGGGDGLKEVCLWQKIGETLVSSSTAAILLDTAPAVLELTALPPVFSSSTAALFSASSSEPLLDLSCRLDPTAAAAADIFPDIVYEGLAEGGHELACEGIDLAGNVSALSYAWTVDLTAPIATITSLTLDGAAITAAWSGSDDFSVATSGLAAFDLEFSIDGGAWREWLTGTSVVSAVFSAVDGGEYAFRVRAFDLAGNTGEWSEAAIITKTEEVKADHIVISEVAVSGFNSPTHEFVQLYNPTASAIDLSGWRIQYKPAVGGAWKNKTGADGLPLANILPGAYFLIAGNKSYYYEYADYNHAATWEFADSGGHVRLLDNNGTEADRLGYGNADEPEGESRDYPSVNNQTYKRKALADSTAADMAAGGGHYALGNGYDSNNNRFDFVLSDMTVPRGYFEPLHLWFFDKNKDCQASETVVYDTIGGNDFVSSDLAWPYRQDGMGLIMGDGFEIGAQLSEPVNAGSLTFGFWYNDKGNEGEGSGSVLLAGEDGGILKIEFGPDRFNITVNGNDMTLDKTDVYETMPEEERAADWIFAVLSLNAFTGQGHFYVNGRSGHEFAHSRGADLNYVSVGADEDCEYLIYKLKIGQGALAEERITREYEEGACDLNGLYCPIFY
ncbi:MAG: lamin tail domain-containing protein [Candidatus Falkowbacteria bacterium]